MQRYKKELFKQYGTQSYEAWLVPGRWQRVETPGQLPTGSDAHGKYADHWWRRNPRSLHADSLNAAGDWRFVRQQGGNHIAIMEAHVCIELAACERLKNPRWKPLP